LMSRVKSILTSAGGGNGAALVDAAELVSAACVEKAEDRISKRTRELESTHTLTPALSPRRGGKQLRRSKT
jgi:hypothetical protein